MTRRPGRRVLAAAGTVVVAGLVLSTQVGRASVPEFWRTSTQEEFLSGEVENLTIGTSGRVSLGPSVELLHETTSPFLWTLVEASDGSLWIGSGNDGRVVRVEPDGSAENVFDAAELEVHALAAGADGAVYVATSPDGRIVRVAADGAVTDVFDPDDRYIWSMAVAADGTLYAGTGEKGIVYRIAPDGSARPFYETKATHVTALAIDPEGRVLAGTESPGRVFRIDEDGTAFVLLESGYQEIHAIRLDDSGRIYAAAVSGRPGGQPAPPPPTTSQPSAPRPSVSTEITVTAVGAAPSQTPATTGNGRSNGGTPSGAVFRIATDGVWDTVWESSEDSPYDVLIDAEGALIIGTGDRGKIFQVTEGPAEITLLTRAGGQQVTSLLAASHGDRYFTTANPGKLFRLSRDRASGGTYTSDVRDAGTIATWGSIRWNGSGLADGALELFSRSGNTTTPDETWSAWAGPYTDAAGGQIASPKARYLQWKAVFAESAATAHLESVTVAYLERNLRPEVTTLTVHPPGVVFQQPFTGGDVPIAGLDPSNGSQAAAAAVEQTQTTPTLGRRVYRKGLRSFGWTARDPNDDSMTYDILYRAESEEGWKPLETALGSPIFAWDTSSVPDGAYVVKIVASDAPSNSPGTALAGERESASFDIDNSAPAITPGSARRGEAVEEAREQGMLRLSFTVTDAQSAVQRVEYSIDARTWRVVYPSDGIPDSRRETFEVDVEAGVARVIVRAVDAMDNVATASLAVEP